MSHFFDTSALISAFDDQDAHHQRAHVAFVRHAAQGAIAAHTIAETFSILTGRRAWRASDASEMIRVNTTLMNKVTITPGEYLRVIEESERLGVRGGAIYDALILAAARKARSTTIWTFNRHHFSIFAPDLTNRIREP